MKTLLVTLGVLAAVVGVFFLLQRRADANAIVSGTPITRTGQNPRTPQGGESMNQSLAKALGIPGAKYIDMLDTKVGSPIRTTTARTNDLINSTIFGGGREDNKPTEVWHKAAINDSLAKKNLSRSQLNKAPGRHDTVSINKKSSFGAYLFRQR